MPFDQLTVGRNSEQVRCRSESGSKKLGRPKLTAVVGCAGAFR